MIPLNLSLNPIFLDLAVLAIGLLLILLEAFEDDKDKGFVGWISIIGIGSVFALSFFSHHTNLSGVSQLASFYSADSFAIFYKRIALGTTLVVLITAMAYRPILSRLIPGVDETAGVGEFFALPVFTCLGLMWMASAIDFIMIFVSLELVTISFYVLVSYTRRSAVTLEAGVKYLILSALSTGFLVYGITWLFGITGQTNISKGHLDTVLQNLPASSETAVLFGLALVLVALGFKIAAVPFQLWVPDVYQGAPTPITAFLSVGSKAAGFIVLMRVINPFINTPVFHDKVLLVLAGMAVLTLLYGNLAALPQTNMKRLLAYSSIAHAGYLLVAVASWGTGESAPFTVSFYLAGYLLMTLLAFLVMVAVNCATGGDDISHFDGLGQRAPLLAFGMLIAMLSLAGVPFTAGFLGKFLVFRDAVAMHQWWLVGVGVVTVAAGFYYYLKVVRAMYWNVAKDTSAIPATLLTKVTVGGLSFLIFFLGVYPRPIFQMLK